MATVRALAPAKINLFLDIVGDAPGGYHRLDTVMQAVALYDTVSVAQTQQPGIRLRCSWADLPLDRRNLAVKAAEMFFAETGCTLSGGLDIHLEKQIPMQAGMGGGSADAAAVLAALDALYQTALPAEALRGIGVKLGADVPFMLHGGCARAGGIGEELSALKAAWTADCRFLIAKPAHAVSTAEAYARYDAMRGQAQHMPPQMLLDALDNADFPQAGAGLFNIFEQACGWPEMHTIKAVMQQNGALGALLTGSGSAIFGLFADPRTAQACAELLSGIVETCAVVPPCPHGAILLPELE